MRAHGLRVTQPRRLVLDALAERPHVTAAEIATTVAADAGSLSRQGLYNVLADLVRTGLVRCIEPAGSAARYELRVGDNHHHLICRACGRVEDVDCAVGATPCLTPGTTPAGFVLDEAEVTWWGTCSSCTSQPHRSTKENS